jgi:hypothetical protein
MTKPGPLVFLALLGYICFPFMVDWLLDPDGHWYRPFIVWLFVVVIAFLIQRYRLARYASPVDGVSTEHKTP